MDWIAFRLVWAKYGICNSLAGRWSRRDRKKRCFFYVNAHGNPKIRKFIHFSVTCVLVILSSRLMGIKKDQD